MHWLRLCAWLVPVLWLCLALSGCSFARLSYQHFPTLAYWQIDRHLDLDSEQKAMVSAHLDALQAWHRREQLAGVGEFLRQVESAAGGSPDASQIRAWRGRVAQAWEALADRMAPAVAQLGPTLRPEQLRSMRERFARANQKFRDEYLPGDPEAVARARAERWIKRASFFLGDLSKAQARELRQQAAQLGSSEAAWLAEREARQQRLAQLLERLSAEKPAPAQAIELSRQMLRGYWKLDDSPRRALLERSIAASDALAARILAQADDGQRRYLSSKLRAYRIDAQELAGSAQPPPVETGSQSPRT